MSGRSDLRQQELLEDRLRTALAARAGSVHLNDLRRGELPSSTTTFRFPVRRATAASLALAAVVAVCLLLLPENQQEKEPVVPAHPSVSHSQRPPAPAISPAVAPEERR